jgi:hypothetical protein
VQPVDAGDGHDTVGGDVLPAISHRAGDIGRADIVPDEGPGLEQVGAAGAAIVDAETDGAASNRKAGGRERGEAIIGADRRTKNAAGGWAGSLRADRQ